MNVAELLVRCLESEGVTHVFGVPGEENEDLLFALEPSSIQFVPTRHEQGAAFIADVWGRLTGRAGVCLATLGPGATNLVTAVADANLDKAPLVALTAQGGLDRLHHESHQAVDVIGMLRPVTKWSAAITSPAIVEEVVRKAFKVAEREKPGATHVELSEDVAGLDVDDAREPIPRRTVRRPAPDPRAVEEAADLLRRARRPLLLAGNGAVRTRASAALRHLAERFDVPVVSTFMGKGAVPDDSPRSLLTIGLGFRDFAARAVDDADLVVAVGYDIAEYAPEDWNPAGDKPIVHVDFEPAEVYVQYAPRVEVVADVCASLQALTAALEEAPGRYEHGWYVPVRDRVVEDVAGYALEPGAPFTIPGVLGVLRRVLPRDGLLISDVGTHKMWIARNFPTYVPGGCLISNGLASMGIALPGGIAASLVDPDRPVVAAMGDGGFLMNSQELETARRVGAGFVCLVLRDDDYGLIGWKQERSRGRSVSTRIGNPDLVEYARSFGVAAYRPEGPAELEARLRAALEARELCLLDVPVDTAVNSELVAKLEQHWSNDP